MSTIPSKQSCAVCLNAGLRSLCSETLAAPPKGAQSDRCDRAIAGRVRQVEVVFRFHCLLADFWNESLAHGSDASLVSCFTHMSSIAASYFSIQHSFVLLLLTFGRIAGFGQGIAYNCVLINMRQWFPHRTGLAAGVILGGFGCAAFIFAPFQTNFINPNNNAVNEKGCLSRTVFLNEFLKCFLLWPLSLRYFNSSDYSFSRKRHRFSSPQIHSHNNLHSSFCLVELLSRATFSVRLLRKNQPLRSFEVSDALRSSTIAVLFVTLLFKSLWLEVISGLYKVAHISVAANITRIGSNGLSDKGTIRQNIFCATCKFSTLVLQTSYQTSMVTVCAVGSALMCTLGFVRFINSSWILTYWPLAGIGADLLSQFIPPYLGYEILFIVVASLLFLSFMLTTIIKLSKYGTSSSMSAQQQ
ncbi:unnamed protein product [Toxocara canis]|uniref:Uncharacterized protein n=1 Tax=Toxocara canis TaxID=6265 RepID=A0A183UCS0_TOXCA|nr:unnamed protein product [Toxocara canis]